jgi:signal transduction histidine kinase
VQEVAGTNLDISELVEAQFKLEEQYLALIELNGSISKFAFKNAHELRGPLSAILGLINLMETTDSRPEYLQFLKKEALALDQVVRDINEVLLSEGKLKP